MKIMFKFVRVYEIIMGIRINRKVNILRTETWSNLMLKDRGDKNEAEKDTKEWLECGKKLRRVWCPGR